MKIILIITGCLFALLGLYFFLVQKKINQAKKKET